MAAKNDRLSQVLDIAIRLGIVFVLLHWSYQILRPFILPGVWGTILAVACYPGYQALAHRLRGRRKTAAVLVSSLMLVALVIPCILMGDSLLTGITLARTTWEETGFRVPPPTEQIKEWPIVGARVYEGWLAASRNLESAIQPFAPQLRDLGRGLLSGIAEFGFTILQFIFSVVIAGVLLASSEKGKFAGTLLSQRLAPERGLELLQDAIVTIRNVARGIIGVALIQAFLAGIGFIAAGIPGAGLWALVSLLLGIIQVGVGPVLLLANIYLFSNASPTIAWTFLGWSLLVAPLDNVLKPLLLGKGAPVPMLVIFLGALGGFMHTGIIGLFVGAVVLSVAFKLLVLWLETPEFIEQPI